ncbi:MAG: hypothetical protein ACEPOV_11485 [Hyphomicrobiales bacterium]
MKKRVLGVASLFLLIILFVAENPLLAQGKKEYKVGIVAFYNLENLFDTIHQDGKKDYEYLPDGKNMWNTNKYKKKLTNMAKVISQIGADVSPDGPAVLGVCEAENIDVLNDLVKEDAIKDKNYKTILVEGPDRRGVDVGFIYNPKYFTVDSYKSHTFELEDKPDFFTRDQLLVSGDFDGERMHFIVLHWPSRYGGEKRSRPLRNAAAKVTRSIVDSVLRAEPNAKIFVMGDLNDDPTNESVIKHLNAKGNKKRLKEEELYNCVYNYFKKGIGTLAYRDNWNNFDQIIVTQSLLNKDFSSYKLYKTGIFNKPFLKNKTGRYKGYPKRTFAGGAYQGGYSDHFPVYDVIIKEK